MAAAEKWHLVAKVFRLKLQLARGREDSRVLSEVSPGLWSHVLSPEVLRRCCAEWCFCWRGPYNQPRWHNDRT